MAECVRIDACTFFNGVMAAMPANVELFKKEYCRGQHVHCARNLLISLLEEKSYQISEAVEAEIERIAPSLAPNHQERVKRLFAS